MPLTPQESVAAATAIIRQVPSLVRWRRLTAEQRQAVLEALAAALAQLALDAVD